MENEMRNMTSILPEPFMYEDDLPEDITEEEYSDWYAKSWVDGVRMGPVFTRPTGNQHKDWILEALRLARIQGGRSVVLRRNQRMSDTPRVDAESGEATFTETGCAADVVNADFARALERQNTALVDALRKIETAATVDLGRRFLQPTILVGILACVTAALDANEGG